MWSCSELCTQLDDAIFWLFFGIIPSECASNEEREELTRQNKCLQEFLDLCEHEDSCVSYEAYDLSFSETGNVLVTCQLCELKLVVSYEALWRWIDQLCFDKLSYRVRVKVGAARRAYSLESTKRGREREQRKKKTIH